MSERKWTPGPWVADDFCMQDDMQVRVGTSNGTPTYYHHSATICECFTNHGEEDRAKDEPLIGPITAERNARLIAAAPDLYEALESLLRFNEELCADVGVSKHYPSAEKARAALARAQSTGA